jgi:ABC-type Fe3+ transport system substrate-binding protein
LNRTDGPLISALPKQGNRASWPQRTAILKDAPHPEGARLLQNFILTKDFQANLGFWPLRRDVPAPAGFPKINKQPNSSPHAFLDFMEDREEVESLRFWFEKRIGTPQGESPVSANASGSSHNRE